MNLSTVIVRDVIASRPTAGIAGRLFFALDTGAAYRDNGTTWESIGAIQAVDLAAGVTGILPVANGGTGSSTLLAVNLASGVTGVLPVANGGTGQSTAPPYDVVCSLAGRPSASQIVLILTFTRAVTFAANWSASRGTVGANPTATATYTVNKNGSSVGTVAIATGGTFTFATSGGTAVSYAAGDRMTITAPGTQDATLSDVGFTLSGTR